MHRTPSLLWAHWRAVGGPGLRPLNDFILTRVFGGEFFIDVDAQAGTVVWIQVAVSDFGKTWENVVAELAEPTPFLDSEIGRPEIEVQVGGVADRRGIPGAVPGGPDVVHVSKGGYVASGRDATHLADVHSDEIDQTILDERRPLAGMVEELTHRDRCRALLAYVAEPFDVFGRQRIFEEEELEGFDIPGELDSVDRAESFVNVVKKFNLRADLRADVFNHVDHQTTV